MLQGCETALKLAPSYRAPKVSYRIGNAADVLAEPGALAVFGFGAGVAEANDPRWLTVELEPLDAPAPLEVWQVDADVQRGREGDLNWSCGGGWLFASITLDEATHGGLEATADTAYRQLVEFLARRHAGHTVRVWNYLAAINQGEGDE